MLPLTSDDGHSWHVFAVLLPFTRLPFTRDQFVQKMKERHIGIGVHYPSIPSLSFYQRLGNNPLDFPNAHRIGAETVTLPLFPAMSISDVDRVCDALLALISF